MLKYVNTGVVFQEIPDEVTLAINISGCPCRCPGCHSRYLWEDITCIAFMGGDGDPKGVNLLAQYIHEEYPQLKVAWYTGRIRVPAIVNKSDFDFIKVGPFIRHLGPLSQPTTNQRLYRQTDEGTFEDITYRFWRK